MSVCSPDLPAGRSVAPPRWAPAPVGTHDPPVQPARYHNPAHPRPIPHAVGRESRGAAPPAHRDGLRASRAVRGRAARRLRVDPGDLADLLLHAGRLRPSTPAV